MRVPRGTESSAARKLTAYYKVCDFIFVLEFLNNIMTENKSKYHKICYDRTFL
jgi:hypothetical protein